MGFAARTWRWSCALCDFDTCEKCADAIQVVNSNQPSRQPSAESCEAPTDPGTPRDDVLMSFKGGAVALLKQAARAETPSLSTPATEGVAGHTPASMQTAQVCSWVYVTQGLESVKRDLSHLTNSTKGAKTKHSCLRPNAPVPRSHEVTLCDALGLPAEGLQRSSAVEDDAADKGREDTLFVAGASPSELAARLIDAMPTYSERCLPQDLAERIHNSRDWLRRLCELELERAARAAAGGEPSDFDAACGVQASEPAAVEQAEADFRQLCEKFEMERAALMREERLEMETLQALGVISS
jgi:hypothetical protein